VSKDDNEYTDLFAAFGEQEDDDRVKELMRLIRYHRNLYYNDPDNTEISDDEFDAYVDELRDLDDQNEVLYEVGAPVDDDSAFEKGTHNIAMTSLDKVNTYEEMKRWVKARYVTWLCVQEKLDGFSISADYENGVLKRVLTRGKGAEGEDITRNAVRMKGIKRRLPTNFTGSLRGEVLFVTKQFDAYNEKAAKTKGWRVYQNMRNGAAGLARRRTEGGQEYLLALFYEIEGSMDFRSHFEKMNYMRKRLGLWTPWFARVQLDGLARVYKEYGDAKRDRLPYEIDGLVIKVDSADECETVEDTLQKSNRATANPKSQVAWKFEAETRVTKVVRVAADFGLGGRVTPVAEVEPVKIGGVTVTRASLHNWDMVADLNIREGGKVLLKRANDVIPQVVRMLDDQGTDATPPTACPKCGGDLTVNGKFLECQNDDCPGVIAGKVRNWIKKLDIKHVGMTDVVEPLVAVHMLRNIADLYELTVMDIEAASSAGIAKRAYKNLHDKKTIALHMLLGSIGIPGFGRSLAKVVVKGGFDTLDKVLAASIKDLAGLPSFGTGRATAVWNGLRANEDMLRKLSTLLIVQGPQAAKGGVLSGMCFCITGSLSSPKKVFQRMIEDAGGEYEKSLKSSVTHLIAADPDGNSGKLQKARKKGTKVIGEDELKKMIAGT